MNYGLQISASGAMTALYRQDVLTNNLANANTVGFKADVAAARQRDAARIEDGLAFMASDRMLERLGAGAMMAPNRVDFEQGSLERTSSPLDMAIEGSGFFVVRDDADTSGDRLRLTRDGRFIRDASGRVVASGSGLPLLDSQNRPIVLNGNGEIQIDADGTVKQDGQMIAKVQIVDIPDTSKLVKHGHSLFRAPANTIASRHQGAGLIRQGYVEQSSVDEIRTIMAITAASRDFESNIGMIQQTDRMMDRAINQLGRVA
jgi:flagellar basal body rod protein FlgG